FGAPKWAESLATTTLTWIADPPGRGALPTLYAATVDVPGGGYWGPGKRGEGPVPAPFPEAALDVAAAERLWEISEELTGVRFDALTAPRRKRRRRPAADKG
ncbi:MAG: oxidoreductase, partial [Candidatus Dormibacteraceae bacterium]